MAATTILVRDLLKGINAYPLPLRTLFETAEKRGLDLDGEATQEIINGKAYNLSKADLLMWLSFAPDISQGGQSFSFTDEQRKQLRLRARQLYDEYDPEGDETDVGLYGYKGSRL